MVREIPLVEVGREGAEPRGIVGDGSPSSGWSFTSDMVRPTSSERRKAPTQPITKSALSRSPATAAGHPSMGKAATTRSMSSMSKGALRAGGVALARRTPARTAFT